jgi:hypothetical protein
MPPLTPITPDYIRVGSRFCLVTWSRLILLALALAALRLATSPAPGLPPTFDGVGSLQAVRAGTGAVLRRAASAVAGRLGVKMGGAPGSGGGAGGGAARRGIVGLMRTWCAAEANAAPPEDRAGVLPQWFPAALGTPGWPGDPAAAECDWAEKTTTDVPFRVCTFARDKDTQVSAYIHKEGHWSGWKKGLAQDMLPILNSAEAWNSVEGRTLVLDVRGHAPPPPPPPPRRARATAIFPSQLTALRLFPPPFPPDWRQPWLLHAPCGHAGLRRDCT